MSAARILYRTRQFWQILCLAPTERELDGARSVLTPAQLDLFFRMLPGEQAHSLRVYSKLVEGGERDPDLLAAALLHDAGKTRYPLKLWERGWIVIGKAVWPRRSQAWSKGELQGSKRVPFWERPFIVAKRHADWGAELAAQAGSSDRTVSLVRHHQESLPKPPPTGLHRQAGEQQQGQGEIIILEDCLLRKLQAADNES